jgi:hypothetical protein
MNTSQEKEILRFINGEKMRPDQIVLRVMKEKEPGYAEIMIKSSLG